MTEKWGQIQGKWDLVRVSRGVRGIRVRVTGSYCSYRHQGQVHEFLIGKNAQNQSDPQEPELNAVSVA